MEVQIRLRSLHVTDMHQLIKSEPAIPAIAMLSEYGGLGACPQEKC